MDESPAMLFYAEKFYSGTADMKAESVGIYIRLLSKLWDMPDGLPNDIKKLARLALVSEKKFKESWDGDYLCEKFILNDKNNFTNERIEIVRGERLKKSEKARESVQKRWGNDKNERNTNVIQTNSERITNDIHISKENSIINNTIKESEDNKPYTPTPKIDWLAELEKSQQAITATMIKLRPHNCTESEAKELREIFLADRRAEPDGNKPDVTSYFLNWVGKIGKTQLDNIRLKPKVQPQKKTRIYE